MTIGELSYPYDAYRRGANGRALVADALIRASDVAQATFPDRDGRRYVTGPAEPQHYLGLFGNLDATSASQARTAARLSLVRRLGWLRHSHETMLARCATTAAMRHCLARLSDLSSLMGDLLGEAHASMDTAGVRLRDVRQGCRQMVSNNNRLRLADAGLTDDAEVA